MTIMYRSYKHTLQKILKDPKEAAAYLNAALEEDNFAAFLMALKDVAEVHGGMGKLAETTELNRENMYRMLSEDGNPRINSLTAVLEAFGLKLSIMPKKRRRSAA